MLSGGNLMGVGAWLPKKTPGSGGGEGEAGDGWGGGPLSLCSSMSLSNLSPATSSMCLLV